jgi:hypothetical protein
MASTDRPRGIAIVTSRLGPDAISISLEDTGPRIEPEVLETPQLRL